jgi:dTDP-4-amino-4,6-dideoxygalactose transaminase
MNRIPLVNLKREYTKIGLSTSRAIHKVLVGGEFILGNELKKFESEFAKYCGVKYAAGLASGTAALHMALTALDIGPGDEVITTTLSFNATGEAIVMCGATPVFADVLENDASIDPKEVEKKITKRTRAILAVHLYGIPARMKELKRISQKYKLYLIEDAAQAHGSLYNGKLAGNLGDIGCFSFMPAKNLGSYGDAGAVVSNNKHLIEKIKRMRDHGRISKYVHTYPAFAERMDNIQAAVLRVKLKYLDKWNKSRRSLAKFYDENLDYGRLGKIKITTGLSNYYVYTVKVKSRKAFQKKLSAKGIDTGIYYPVPMHLQPYFRNLNYKKGALPIAEKLAASILSLPMNPFINSRERKYIVDSINSVVKE